MGALKLFSMHIQVLDGGDYQDLHEGRTNREPFLSRSKLVPDLGRIVGSDASDNVLKSDP